MSSPIKCRTFCDRLYKCSDYEEKNSYIKGVTYLFNRLLNKYKATHSTSFLEFFSKEFSNRCYTGINFIYPNDRELFKQYCITCAANLDLLFSNLPIINILDSYEYKYKITGNIGGQIKNKSLNIYFSFKNISETEKDLDFYEINNYIYNQTKKISNDCLVMTVHTNSFYLVKYDKTDYTMRRGYLSSISKNRMKKRGEHCINCKKQCKPTFINGLSRLENIL